MLDAFDLYTAISCLSPENTVVFGVASSYLSELYSVGWDLIVISNRQIVSGQQVRTFAEAVEQYAQMGLRTLCLAWRKLDDDEYQEWASMFKEANSTLVDREVK